MSNHRRVLVTGASAGIGRHAAAELASLGWEVFAAARRVDALASLKAECGENLHAVRLDVTDAASVKRMAEEVFDRTHGYGLDGVVNNAGIAIVGPLYDVDEEDLRAQFETNVFGLMRVTRAFLPKMIARRRGRIVNVSSSGGRVSLPFVGVYHATKYAVEALSDTYRMELAPFGIRVSIIEPGPIRSEFGEKMMSTTDRIKRGSPYESIVADAARIQRFAEARMSGPEIVTRDIVHALTSSSPRERYVEPRILRLLIGLYWLTPTWLSDWFIRRFAGLTEEKLLPPANAPQTSSLAAENE